MNPDPKTIRKVIAGAIIGVSLAASTLWAIRHYKTLDERRTHRGEEWAGGDFYFGNELVCLDLSSEQSTMYRYDVTVIPRPLSSDRAATIFYQRRETEESGSRLVLVEGRRIDETHVELGVTIAASPSNIWSPGKISIELPRAKLYHGQPDPIGRSHLTIRYDSPAGSGTIDAWLKPDNTIQFEAPPIGP